MDRVEAEGAASCWVIGQSTNTEGAQELGSQLPVRGGGALKGFDV